MLCESYGGAFGHTDLTGDDVSGLWSCNGWSATDATDEASKELDLFLDCYADGGSAQVTLLDPPSYATQDSTCV